MLGLKNKFSAIYERVMSKYTVKKPTYDEDSDSDELFERIFGSRAMEVRHGGEEETDFARRPTQQI